MSESPPTLSLARVFKVALPLIVVAIVAYFVWASQVQTAAREQGASDVLPRMLGAGEPTSEDETMVFADADGDLVADAPDASECVHPDVLMFSYVAGEVESVPEDTWKELLAALSKQTGSKVLYVHFPSVGEQLAALRNGQAHIAGLNTGTVPTAVRHSGFVPLCTFGHDDGSFGYTMKLLVPADSPIKKPSDIRGHKVTFTRLDSNSGFKAALVYLMDAQDMIPERDYDWGFSQGHDQSIQGVASKEFEVVPVASDMLARAIEKGEVDAAAIRTVYESERFPPATIGYAYNLSPELRDAIRETLLGFDWEGTGLQREFEAEATCFVPVNYKEDWANTRKVDQLISRARQGKM